MARRKQKPHFYRDQRRWIADASAACIWEKTRRAGGTYATSYKATMPRLRGDRKWDYWFSSADEETALLFIDYCDFWCERLRSVVDRFEHEIIDPETKDVIGLTQCLKFKDLGCCIRALSSNPRAIRGKGGDMTLDEYAHHEKQRKMWAAASPVVLWGFQLCLLSTHNGVGSEFNQFCQDARLSGEQKAARADVLEWSHHKTTITDAIDQGLVEIINRTRGTKWTRENFLGWCRRLAKYPDIFSQEFMCVPSSETLAWLTYEALRAIETQDVRKPNEAPSPGGDGLRYVGVDVGRKRDLTAVWIGERVGDVIWPREIKNLRNLSLPVQREILTGVLADTRVTKVLIDQTGIGLGLCEELSSRFGVGRVEGVTFTNANKQVLANDLREAVEDQKLRTPADYELREELHSVKKTVTQTGLVRFDSERDERGHADNFWAAALMVHAAKTGEQLSVWLPSKEGPMG